LQGRTCSYFFDSIKRMDWTERYTPTQGELWLARFSELLSILLSVFLLNLACIAQSHNSLNKERINSPIKM
jgi:hypothetical protein